MLEFQSKFNWSLFLRIQLTINKYLDLTMAWHRTCDKPLPEPMLTKFCYAIWHDQVMISCGFFEITNMHTYAEFYRTSFKNGHYILWNRPISQSPQCSGQISHNTPFCNRNVHISVTKWCIVEYGLVHCGICLHACWHHHINSLWPSDTIWWHRSGST